MRYRNTAPMRRLAEANIGAFWVLNPTAKNAIYTIEFDTHDCGEVC
jgi:hypothetical protein